MTGHGKDVVVDRGALERALGPVASLTWHVLLARRDVDGVTWCGVPWLAGEVGRGRRTVDRALRRLVDVGLVEPAGWRTGGAAAGRGQAPSAYARRVRGRLDGDRVCVPRASADALGLAHDARIPAGASRRPQRGAPPAAGNAGASVLRRALRGACRRVARAHMVWTATGRVRGPCAIISDYERAINALGPRPGSSWSVTLRLEPPPGTRLVDVPRWFVPENLIWHEWRKKADDGSSPRSGATCQNERTKQDSSTNVPGNSESPLILARKSSRFGAQLIKGNRTDLNNPPSEDCCAPTAVAARRSAGSSDTERLSGGPVSGPRGPLAGDRIPSYPTVDVVPAIEVPRMPSVLATGDQVANVTLLVTAYRAAVRHRFGDVRQCNVYARGGVHRGVRNFRMLASFAELLVDVDVKPHGWCMFSIDGWASYKGDGSVPPVPYVFSRSRLQKQHGWYRSTCVEARSTGVGLAPLHRLLIARWNHMQAALVGLSHPRTVQAVRAVINQFFPGDSWDRAVEAAREESEQISTSLASSVSDGRWIWG